MNELIKKVLIIFLSVILIACSDSKSDIKSQPGAYLVGTWVSVNNSSSGRKVIVTRSNDNANTFLIDDGANHYVTNFQDGGLYSSGNQIAGYDQNLNNLLYEHQLFKKSAN